MKLLLLVLLLLVAIPAFTQQDSVKITTPGDTVVVTETWTVNNLPASKGAIRSVPIKKYGFPFLEVLPITPKLRWESVAPC